MINALILGVIQGLTEFLPVSSSGHLVLAQSVLPGFSEPGLIFDLMLHAATLMAVLIYYRCDIIDLITVATGINKQTASFDKKSARIYIAAIVIATIPAALIGVFLQDYIESVFNMPMFTGGFLCVTGIFLITGELLASRLKGTIIPYGSWRWREWILVGLAQSLALLPGISRSGSTISTALALGWNREESARFSFFLMIPAVGGAVLLKLGDLAGHLESGAVALAPLVIGMGASFVSGYMAIHLLIKIIKQYRLSGFAIYCFIVGTITIVMNLA